MNRDCRELKSDDTTFANKFQARLKYDTFKSEIVTNIKKLKGPIAPAHVLNKESEKNKTAICSPHGAVASGVV